MARSLAAQPPTEEPLATAPLADLAKCTSNPRTALASDLLEKLGGRVWAGRELIRRQRASAETVLSTSIPALDALIGGGIERGTTLELIGRASSGRFSLVLALLAAVTRCGEPAALVDRGGMLDPRAARAAGIDLPRLLWVRPHDMRETLASAEIVLEAGMPLVVVDLGLPPLEGGRGSEAAWLRLARAARSRRTALCIAAPYRVSGTAAGTVIETYKTRACWQPSPHQPAHSRSRPLAPAPWLLHGLTTHLKLAKQVARARRPSAGSPGASRGTQPGDAQSGRPARAARPGDQEACHLRVKEAVPAETDTARTDRTTRARPPIAASATDAA